MKVINQDNMKTLYGEQLKTAPLYRKYTPVMAYQATEIEVIETITSSGKETVNTAQPGDFVVTNTTNIRETYVLKPDKFLARYEQADSRMNQYDYQQWNPTGTCRAIVYQGEPFVFMASWGEIMVCQKNNLLCTTGDDIYRIDTKEFLETYIRVID